MFELLQKFSSIFNHKKNDVTFDITKGINSVICFPSKTGFNFDLVDILKGENDGYMSNVKTNKEILFFNDYDELKTYLNTTEWQESWKSKVPVAVFFLGYSLKDAPTLFEKSKFSELVVRAIHLDDLLVQTSPPQERQNPRIVENTRFNSYLLNVTPSANGPK